MVRPKRSTISECTIAVLTKLMPKWWLLFCAIDKFFFADSGRVDKSVLENDDINIVNFNFPVENY